MAEENKKLQKMMESGKSNSDSFGISMAVVLTWALTTYSGVEIPAEVVAAFSCAIGALTARIKDKI